MKSKNVKSVSYAKGPKLPLSKNCSIVESTVYWPAASSHIFVAPFCCCCPLRHAGRPHSGSCARFGSHLG